MTDDPKPAALIDDTEKLVQSIVRDAKKRRRLPDTRDADGNIVKGKMASMDMLDRTRAADIALKFLAVKAKIDPEEKESEFERLQRKYHGEGDSDLSAAQKPSNGHAGPAD